MKIQNNTSISSCKHASKYIKWVVAIVLLLALLLVSAIAGLSVGELKLSLLDVWHMLIKGNENSMEYLLISQVRLPRVILGIAVGGSLSLAGVILQGIYRNPLVEPFTLGISGGASLGVAFTIVLGLHSAFGSFMLPLSGFIGAFSVILLVYVLSTRKASVNIQSMLLTGVMISFIASSAMMFLMAITSSDNLHGIVFWIMGSLDEPDLTLIYFTLVVGIIVLLISYLFVQPLNALRLGEEKAMHLGINTNLVIKLMFLLASLLAGICVSVAGVIGFVGLIIPHILRLILGYDYRILLISSFLLGGIFLVLSDIVARSIISPNELPIGVITGIAGGLVFLMLMGQKRSKTN